LRHIGPTYLHRLAPLCTGRLRRVTLVTNMTQYPGGPSMPDNGQSLRATLNPTALSLQDVAMLLSRMGGQPISEEMIRVDLAEGAPTNVDGTINLVHYAAWLVKEMSGAN
jgi:hypothetical protein